jgi:hypothetical protein
LILKIFVFSGSYYFIFELSVDGKRDSQLRQQREAVAEAAAHSS